MADHRVEVAVQGPWSWATSRAFWEGFTPSALPEREGEALQATFLVEGEWRRAEVSVTQRGATAVLSLSGDGDLDLAAVQACRFLSLDVDGRAWPDIALRDPVIASAQASVPGLRPCGFYSPYEAAAWSVLAQRVRMSQAATLKASLLRDGVFPAPAELLALDLDLPGRKAEYLRAVASAALDGLLDAVTLRSMKPAAAVLAVQQVKGLGPFAAELVVLRGANAPDAVPHNESRLTDEVAERYGRPLAEVSEAWRPYRTWAAVHLRVLRERRLGGAMAASGR
ncbi:DNA-3-methyladenine glycosylase 2 family protein [Lentzea sp. BCCO 10_0798]|uniref:DNA-3-methyladenine glycosylase 2 family protein n=1 Tax=Lentzea kristufekii TaxID=3095430 RepID=A0ABU4TX51_9PSEU|nr:DNA-3-methyladenine glycosylase 2 family protein [Lentzea sp. BCCO 10_0798]MDX8052894.1 DNA-3-methyladenine glycosylase 2 family protein [Lentzea sp. BCCO 10_0798]